MVGDACCAEAAAAALAQATVPGRAARWCWYGRGWRWWRWWCWCVLHALDACNTGPAAGATTAAAAVSLRLLLPGDTTHSNTGAWLRWLMVCLGAVCPGWALDAADHLLMVNVVRLGHCRSSAAVALIRRDYDQCGLGTTVLRLRRRGPYCGTVVAALCCSGQLAVAPRHEDACPTCHGGLANSLAVRLACGGTAGRMQQHQEQWLSGHQIRFVTMCTGVHKLDKCVFTTNPKVRLAQALPDQDKR